MKRVFIVHGWGGRPDEAWFPWIKKELEDKGYKVFIPAMPETDEPKMELWIPFLSQLVGKPDLNTFFVGHSIGCQAIIRYLETLPEGTKIGGAVFVAGWYNVRNIDTEEDKRIVEPWLNTARDDEKIKRIINKVIAIFSDNDPFVSPENQKSWQEKVGAKIIVEHNKGHFNEEEPSVWELPSALEALLEISK